MSDINHSNKIQKLYSLFDKGKISDYKTDSSLRFALFCMTNFNLLLKTDIPN